MSYNLSSYIEEATKDPLLTPEEEKRLFTKYKKTGDNSIKNDIFMANTRLVISIAKDFAYNREELEDLIQEGNLGLLHAIDRFDVEKETKFSTYATYWIKQKIFEAKKNSPFIHIPQEARRDTKLLLEAKEKYKETEGKEPTFEDLEKITGIPFYKAEYLLNSAEVVESLDESISVDSDMTVRDIIADEKTANPEVMAAGNILKETVREILQDLDERSREVIVRRFGLDGEGVKTRQEVAQEFGLTTNKIKIIEEKAIRKLKHPRYKTQLKAFV